MSAPVPVPFLWTLDFGFETLGLGLTIALHNDTQIVQSYYEVFNLLSTFLVIGEVGDDCDLSFQI